LAKNILDELVKSLKTANFAMLISWYYWSAFSQNWLFTRPSFLTANLLILLFG